MLRLWLFLFFISLCFFTTLRFNANEKAQRIFKIENLAVKDKEATIKVYMPIRIHTQFTCLTLSSKTYVFKLKSKQSIKLNQLQKGQKLCLNFPQDLLKTSLQITLKEIKGEWLRVTIMGDSILLSGYVPLHTIKNWNRLQASDMAEYSSGGELLLNAPKITSNDIELISGNFSLQHVLQIARERLELKEYDSVRKWLALAQSKNPAELEIYDIYASLLTHEGKKEEAIKLMQMLNKAKKKQQTSKTE